MSCRTNDNKTTLIQCMECGEISEVNLDIPFKHDYIDLFCPKCKEYHRCLNLGHDEDDKYLYMDINVDPNCYRY